MRTQALLLGALALAGCSTPAAYLRTTPTGVVASGPLPSAPETYFQSQQTYKGWPGSWLVSNGRVWAAVVPSIGRVMQFGAVNDPGVFWENPRLLGQPLPTEPWKVPGSFGGDKAWPAPQSAWGWPPPDVFDREAVRVRTEPGALVLESGVSPRYGIRTERRVELLPGEPTLRITTTYHKVEGPPVEVGVWVITQLQAPTAVHLPIPAGSRFPSGHSGQWGTAAGFLSREGDRLRITRDPKQSHKVGNDGDTMVWEGPRHRLTITSPRIPGATYPDGGCSVEVYTNGGAADYVELETLGPLRRLAAGESATSVNLYRLEPRPAGAATTGDGSRVPIANGARSANYRQP